MFYFGEDSLGFFLTCLLIFRHLVMVFLNSRCSSSRPTLIQGQDTPESALECAD